MDGRKQREIAQKGGRAAHEKGTAHEFTSDEARAAGRKGGERVSANREHMAAIGRLGGRRSAGRRAAAAAAATGNASPSSTSSTSAHQGHHGESRHATSQESPDMQGSVEAPIEETIAGHRPQGSTEDNLGPSISPQ